MSINKETFNKILDECMKDSKIVSENICDEILDEYIKDDKIDVKDICDEIFNEDMKEDKIVNKDICDKVPDEYIEEEKFINKFTRDTDKKMEEHSHLEEAKIYVNCNLKVDFDTKNKMIYLYPGKTQFFTVDVSKSCGDVTIKYQGCYTSKGICGNLGIYRIVQSGIVVETYNKLNPKKKDILNFTAIDKCTKECYEFVVIFSYNPCGCYY